MRYGISAIISVLVILFLNQDSSANSSGKKTSAENVSIALPSGALENPENVHEAFLFLVDPDGDETQNLQIDSSGGNFCWSHTLPGTINSFCSSELEFAIDSGDYDLNVGQTGTIVINGLTLSNWLERPTCDEAHRGKLWYTQSGASVADKLEICVKNSSDGYAWLPVITVL